jgi:hypothetical protein
LKDLDAQAELRDLCARRDIYEVICNYMRGQDRLMPALHRSAFHDDAFVDCGTFTGDADGFVKFAQGFLGQMTLSHHLMGQAQIRVQGNVASGEVYFTAFHRLVQDGRDQDLVVAGRYVDEYEDRGAGWKIAKRRLLVDWVRTEDAADGFVKQTAALILGARGDEDFSNRRDWPPRG